jgi:PA domain
VRAPRSACALAALVFAAAPAVARGVARITIQNDNGPTVGFNDPTPATPVGGNTGTTLGAQRLIVFERAAAIWGELLDSPVEIVVKASFLPLPCEADSGALGGARTGSIVLDAPTAPLHAWYPVALANKLAGVDLTPGAQELTAVFNSRVGELNCLESFHWYYGLDGNHGDGLDLLTVLLHELAHGLGFATIVAEWSGSEFQNQPDVFESRIFDTQASRYWTEMNSDERRASAINTGHLVWDGPAVRAAAADLLEPLRYLSVIAPPEPELYVDVNPAPFGAGITGEEPAAEIAEALDAADADGESTTDACSAITNGSAIAGRIALVDSGACDFSVQAANVQAAGAVGLIVASDRPGGLPSVDGTDPSIRIPVAGISQEDGTAIRSALGGGPVAGAFHVDPRRRMGMGTDGRPLLYAPNPDAPGSSISHWDVSATPNLLMEPFLSDDLGHGVDLTLPLLYDIGWREAPLPETENRAGVGKVDAGRNPTAVAPRP